MISKQITSAAVAFLLLVGAADAQDIPPLPLIGEPVAWYDPLTDAVFFNELWEVFMPISVSLQSASGALDASAGNEELPNYETSTAPEFLAWDDFGGFPNGPLAAGDVLPIGWNMDELEADLTFEMVSAFGPVHSGRVMRVDRIPEPAARFQCLACILLLTAARQFHAHFAARRYG